MGWGIGYDGRTDRFIGYGVPAYCDHPECSERINRGLSYVCGTDPYGGDEGCGLYFCATHRNHSRRGKEICARCKRNRANFAPKPEHPDWLAHVLGDESWAEWRAENPAKSAEYSAALRKSVTA